MELIHGIAMKLPLSPQTVSLGDLVKGFNQNTELTNRLCRSEKVESVEAVLPEKDENQKVAIPGGRFGMQAFYCILENIARDCAKYGGSPRNMELQIDVEQPDAKRDEKRVFADGLLRVRVKDKRGPEISEEYQEEVKKKKEIVQNALNNLQIADYDGTLVDGYWGVKERFIAAALLRGIRVEDLDPFRPDDRPKSRTLLDASPPRIIDLVMDSETFEWEFYLLQAKEVLVIGSLDAVSTREGYESWKIGHEVEELDAKVAQAAAIRHRFVILEPKDQHELEWMLKNRECFPYRTFLAGDLVTDNQLTGGLARLNSQALLDWKSNPNDMKRQQNLKNDLARQWIRSLCKERNLDGRFILLMHNGDWFRVDWSKDSFTRLIGAKAKEVPSLAKDTENCLGVFHRHWPASLAKLYSEGQYMEIYSGDDSLVQLFESGESDQIQKYKLFESALVRILIIDERIDESAQAAVPDQHSPGEVNIWKRLAMKGIAVRGQEYSGQPSEYKGKLESWLEEANVHQYHFISIHRGILEKLEKNCSQPADQICAKLRKCTENLFVHSARSGLDGLVKNPEELGIRYIPLSNVSAWLDSRRSKWDVVDELSNIRRTA